MHTINNSFLLSSFSLSPAPLPSVFFPFAEGFSFWYFMALFSDVLVCSFHFFASLQFTVVVFFAEYSFRSKKALFCRQSSHVSQFFVILRFIWQQHTLPFSHQYKCTHIQLNNFPLFKHKYVMYLKCVQFFFTFFFYHFLLCIYFVRLLSHITSYRSMCVGVHLHH